MQAGLNMERGIKKSRVAFVLWYSEIKPLFDRFVTLFFGLLCIHCIPYIWSDFVSDSDFLKKTNIFLKTRFCNKKVYSQSSETSKGVFGGYFWTKPPS